MAVKSLGDLVNIPQATALLNRHRGGAPPSLTCMSYDGLRSWDGYGVIAVNAVGDTWRNRTQMRAHRLAFLLDRGYLPQWPRVVAHSCHNRLCCNPEHLKDIHNDENMADMVTAGRQYRGVEHYLRQNPEKVAGELNPSARLTRADVDEIRRLFHAHWKLTDIARHFGISRTHACRIVMGLSWRS